MALPKPTSKLDWTQGNPNFGDVTIEPSSGKKLAGWASNERPPFQFMNWQMWIIDEWVNYLESVADEIGGLSFLYDHYVGSNPVATHSNLQDALDDANEGDRIYVFSDATVNSTIQISTNAVEIYIKNGVTFSKGSATLGLQVSADRVKIVGGKFEGFNVGGDKAISIDVGSDYTMIRDMRFNDNDTDIEDLSATSSILGNITE